VIPRRSNLCDGSPHPKARDAASQEGSANVLKLWETLKGVRYDWRNIHTIWRRNGLFLTEVGGAAESRKRDLILRPPLA
jgi:hypothetical protein